LYHYFLPSFFPYSFPVIFICIFYHHSLHQILLTAEKWFTFPHIVATAEVSLCFQICILATVQQAFHKHDKNWLLFIIRFFITVLLRKVSKFLTHDKVFIYCSSYFWTQFFDLWEICEILIINSKPKGLEKCGKIFSDSHINTESKTNVS
jgi:hypothetical protein